MIAWLISEWACDGLSGSSLVGRSLTDGIWQEDSCWGVVGMRLADGREVQVSIDKRPELYLVYLRGHPSLSTGYSIYIRSYTLPPAAVGYTEQGSCNADIKFCNFKPCCSCDVLKCLGYLEGTSFYEFHWGNGTMRRPRQDRPVRFHISPSDHLSLRQVTGKLLMVCTLDAHLVFFRDLCPQEGDLLLSRRRWCSWLCGSSTTVIVLCMFSIFGRKKRKVQRVFATIKAHWWSIISRQNENYVRIRTWNAWERFLGTGK